MRTGKITNHLPEVSLALMLCMIFALMCYVTTGNYTHRSLGWGADQAWASSVPTAMLPMFRVNWLASPIVLTILAAPFLFTAVKALGEVPSMMMQ
jgi:hypothetical protein